MFSIKGRITCNLERKELNRTHVPSKNISFMSYKSDFSKNYEFIRNHIDPRLEAPFAITLVVLILFSQ